MVHKCKHLSKVEYIKKKKKKNEKGFKYELQK